jgi:hypothetical protein
VVEKEEDEEDEEDEEVWRTTTKSRSVDHPS